MTTPSDDKTTKKKPARKRATTKKAATPTEAEIEAAANDNDEAVVDEAVVAERIAAEQRDNGVARKPLALKMARVMAEVRHVPKNGRNEFHKYNYIMESDLLDRLRGKLAEQGVALLPSIREHVSEQTKDARGKVQNLATVTLDITFIDGESGDEFTTTWVGQGVDAGDKAYYKAYTGAFKYALLKTFLVTAEEDASPSKMPAPRSNYRGRAAGGRR